MKNPRAFLVVLILLLVAYAVADSYTLGASWGADHLHPLLEGTR